MRGRRKLIVVLLLFSLVLLSSSCVKLLNHAPVVENPSPANNATDVPINTTLTWEAEDEDGDALTFDVYFGTSSNPPLVKSGISEKSYNPETLEYGTTYYWKVVAKDGKGGIAESPVWKFTTTRLKWKFETGYVDSSPAIGQDGTIYIGSYYPGGHHLYAINPDGTLKWQYETGSYIYYSSPAIGEDGTIYVGSYVESGDGYLYAIETDSGGLQTLLGPCSTTTCTTLAAMVTTDGNNTALPRWRQGLSNSIHDKIAAEIEHLVKGCFQYTHTLDKTFKKILSDSFIPHEL